jgi:hypothetical protein
MEPAVMNMMQEAEAKKVMISQRFETLDEAAWVMKPLSERRP